MNETVDLFIKSAPVTASHGLTLRGYQNGAVEKIFEAWQEHDSTLLVCPTGGGKTLIFAEVIKKVQPQRVLVLVHRIELVKQARASIERHTGLECDIEAADLIAEVNEHTRSQVVIGMVQTLISGAKESKRRERFDPESFGLVIVDECFIPGTLVDGKPIEKVQYGDSVTTHLGTGTVTHVFRNRAARLKRITLEDGRQIVSTLNHPYWTPDGFRTAASLTFGDMVLTIIGYEQMYNLWRTGKEKTVRQKSVSLRTIEADDSRFLPQAWRRDHEISQDERDARPGNSRLGIDQATRDGLEADNSRRERARANNPAASIGSGTRLGYGSSDSDRQRQEEWLSNLLQGGHWAKGIENWGRGRWQLSHPYFSTGTRCEERRAAFFSRVASVEILEPGSDGEFERLCPKGIVYNLEVSNGNTYCANGVLVHNCHHAISESWKATIEHFRQNQKLKILGVTATPDRHDEKALGQVFQSVADDIEILDLVQQGYLVRPLQQFIPIEGLDYSHIRVTAGELNGADLNAVMESEETVQGMIQGTFEVSHGLAVGALAEHQPTEWALQVAGKRELRTLIFAASVKCAEMYAAILNRVKPDSALWVSGKTPDDERESIFRKFSNGQTQYLVNVGVATEGYDNPGIEMIVLGRRTLSRSLYAQMIGRGTRTLPGVIDGLLTDEARLAAISGSAKPHLTVVDFVGNAGRLRLISMADILGGKYEDDVIDAATERAEKGGKQFDMSALLEEEALRLREESERRRLLEEARKKKVVAKAKYRAPQNIDPFSVFGITPERARAWDDGRQLSEKQRALFVKHIGDPDDYETYTQQKQLLNELFRRWNANLCSLKQANLLKKHGYDTKDVTMQKASELIDALAKNGWKRPEPALPVSDTNGFAD